jgi:phospho-N-acetylmuramoyl-pentapeptide-transferase
VIAMLMAAGAAFLFTVFFTPLLIRRLRVLGIGQQIRDDGPIEHPHAAKAGTPTMGGIAIVLATLIGYLVAHIRRDSIAFATPGWALIALIVGLGIVGWIDDYLGVRAHRNLGLRKRGKTLGIVVIAAAFAWLAVYFVHTDTHLSFTQPLSVDLGKVGMFLWIVLVVYATANAVNLTDGLDGLAAGSSAFTFAAFMIIAFTEFRHPLIYNVLPAQALDQAVVAAAMLGACAGLPAIETLSVIAQVISYRGFRRRVLRMAPIHHHFEVGGWSEFTVIVRFWLFAGICVALGVGIFYADFLRHGINLG